MTAVVGRVRVVVVLNCRRDSVHGMTTDNEVAQRWCRELIDQYGGDNLAARQYVSIVPVLDGTWWPGDEETEQEQPEGNPT